MLRIARELLGVSQKVLASELNLDPRAIQRVEAIDPSSSLDRQELLVAHFQTRGILLLPPTELTTGWSVIECLRPPDGFLPARLIRAARVGLDRSQAELGTDANLGTMTIRRIEADKPTVEPETRQFLIEYIESQGVRFLPPTDAYGWGICFTSINDRPTARHPRARVQKRKSQGSA